MCNISSAKTPCILFLIAFLLFLCYFNCFRSYFKICPLKVSPNEYDGKTFCTKYAFALCSQMTDKIQQWHFGNRNYLHRRQMTRHGKAAFCSHQRATYKFSHGTYTHFYLQTSSIEQLDRSISGEKRRRLEGQNAAVLVWPRGELVHCII